MEQRRLRLGDILDDYCPRERRLTNHAVVAMIEEDVKQTRCTTCDTEHAYKGGKVPKRRKKETTATLYKEVLASQSNADGPHIVPEAEPEPSETVTVIEEEQTVVAARQSTSCLTPSSMRKRRQLRTTISRTNNRTRRLLILRKARFIVH
jgi:hypothetical protein